MLSFTTFFYANIKLSAHNCQIIKMNIQNKMQLIKLDESHSGYWFIISKGKLWLPQGDIPVGTAKNWHLIDKNAQIIGTYQGQTAWLISQNAICFDKQQLSEMSTIRSLILESELFLLAGKAIQLTEFYLSHKYCGYCKHEMLKSKTEWCVLCEHCNNRYYPQISPAIIVAIRNKDKILLAKHKKHQQDNLYTVLAGFTEVGETIETTIHREVYEEAGIKIKNIRYIHSQPWPFPNAIMLAYLADYESGTLTIDKNELIEANWYSEAKLPRLPEYGTIARRLIEETLVLCRQEVDSF